MSSQFFKDSIFWIEVEKIKPNPFQPRKEFDDLKLKDLAESIRMYGILQPLVVTRREYTKDDGGLAVDYELISGERRLRASKIAGLSQVPALIRSGDESDREKLELAIIENLQREDLNPVDRARAFERLTKEFGFKHNQIAEKVGKSREYVTNTMRILLLPEEILNALAEGKISEGHTRPLLMLADRKEEQQTLFKEIIYKKLTVRDAEAISRRVAQDRVRKKNIINPEIVELEQSFKEALGTRVYIETKEKGGRLSIDFFSPDDLRFILDMMKKGQTGEKRNMLEKHIEENSTKNSEGTISNSTSEQISVKQAVADLTNATPLEVNKDVIEAIKEEPQIIDDRSAEDKEKDENSDELYSIKNFSI